MTNSNPAREYLTGDTLYEVEIQIGSAESHGPVCRFVTKQEFAELRVNTQIIAHLTGKKKVYDGFNWREYSMSSAEVDEVYNNSQIKHAAHS